MRFNLSKKIIFGGLSNGNLDDDHAVIQRRDVREFIKRLKKYCDKRIKEVEEKDNCENIKRTGSCAICDNVKYEHKDMIDFINKLAGEKLI